MAEESEIDSGWLTDAAGVRHPLAGPEARIVSLVPSITELLFDLGLGEQVVGRTRYCVHPAKALVDVAVVAGTKQLDGERFCAVRPTHAIVNVDENTLEMVEEMVAMGVRVVATHPLAPRDNLRLYQLLGTLFGVPGRAAELAEAFSRALDRLLEIASALPLRRVLYLIWRKPWMTVSRSTYISRTLGLVNWTTIGHRDSERYPCLDDPCPLVREADLVLFSSEPFPFQDKHIDEMRARCGETSAQFAMIDAEMVSWYGSRAIPGLDYLREYALGTRF